jgi:hypothetical protein
LFGIYRSEFCLKQGDVSTVFHFKYALIYAIREVTANEKNLKLNETLEILFCANDTNLLRENKLSVKEMKEGLSWSLAMRIVQ